MNNEDAEFTELVLRQSRFVFRVAYAVLLNGHDAEDAAQETFVKLFRNGGWRNAENERAFLARAAWRIAQDMRRQRCNSGGPRLVPEGENLIELPSAAPGPEECALHGSSEALMHRMIDALPEELRVPLALSAFEELNSREIGEVLAVPEGTVRTRIQRARQMLRQKLGVLEEHRAEARYAR